MGWAESYIEKLQAGEQVQFRPSGNSMQPRIKSGQLCTVDPIDGPPEKGDIVLCRVGRAEYLHKVLAVDDTMFQIGNAKGRVNGWIGLQDIFGILVRVDR